MSVLLRCEESTEPLKVDKPRLWTARAPVLDPWGRQFELDAYHIKQVEMPKLPRNCPVKAYIAMPPDADVMFDTMYFMELSSSSQISLLSVYHSNCAVSTAPPTLPTSPRSPAWLDTATCARARLHHCSWSEAGAQCVYSVCLVASTGVNNTPPLGVSHVHALCPSICFLTVQQC